MELCFFSPVLYNNYDNCFATAKLWDVQLHDKPWTLGVSKKTYVGT